jgi:hypothetical protein
MRQRHADVGIRRHGDRWQISYYDQYGRRRFETVRGSLTAARKVRAAPVHQVQSGRFGLRDRQRMPALAEFVDRWRKEVAGALALSTRRGYETALRHHILPAFGSMPLDAISKATVQQFIAKKSAQQRFDYTKGRNPNPARPTLSGKTIRNMVAVISAILQSAVEDYELLERNPLVGVLRTRRRRRFPMRKLRSRPKVHVLEPDEFRRAVDAVSRDDVRRMILVAGFRGVTVGGDGGAAGGGH